MEVTRREKETVEAEQAQAMAKGSHVIVKMIGPDILRSIETTETAVTAMTVEIARNKMKDTDVAEMHTETGKSQKRKGGRPEGSLALTAGKIEKKIASETAVGTETAAPGRIGVRGGPGKTTDPGRTKTGRTVDPAVAMMKVNAPKVSGVTALRTEKRPELAVRIVAPNTERPDKTEARETVVGPPLNKGDKNAQLIVKSPNRMIAPRPDPTRPKTTHTTRQPKKEEASCQGKRRGCRPPSIAQRPPAIAQAVPDTMGEMEQNQ